MCSLARNILTDSIILNEANIWNYKTFRQQMNWLIYLEINKNSIIRMFFIISMTFYHFLGSLWIQKWQKLTSLILTSFKTIKSLLFFRASFSILKHVLINHNSLPRINNDRKGLYLINNREINRMILQLFAAQ